LVFVMLNPSTADASKDDATIRRCIGFAKQLKFGGIKVVNLFAFRLVTRKSSRRRASRSGQKTTLPSGRPVLDPDGKLRPLVLCAWGSNARGLKQADDVLAMLREMGVRPHALAT
jgi:hypothetical protein